MALNTNMKVLVVDDFATMRRIVKNILKQLGYDDITEAEDGESALSKLKTGNYELLVTDWNMPNMSGIDLLREIRSDAKLKELPVLMVTAESQKENIMEAAKAGVNNYIVKPFTPEIFNAKLAKIFG